MRPRDTLSPPPQALQRSSRIQRAGPPHQLLPLCTSTPPIAGSEPQICQDIPGSLYIVFHRLYTENNEQTLRLQMV